MKTWTVTTKLDPQTPPLVCSPRSKIYGPYASRDSKRPGVGIWV